MSRSKQNIYSLFETWVHENNRQFSVPLIRAPYKKGKTWYFNGISKDLLTLQVDDGGIVVWAWHEGKPVDMILDLDAVLDYKPDNGYFFCDRIEPLYYKSVKEMYIVDCFEWLRIWINMRLSISRYIDIFYIGDRDGICSAMLDIEEKLRKKFITNIRSLFPSKAIDIEKVRVDLWK